MWQLITQSKIRIKSKQAGKYSSFIIARKKEIGQVFSVTQSDTKKVGGKMLWVKHISMWAVA